LLGVFRAIFRSVGSHRTGPPSFLMQNCKIAKKNENGKNAKNAISTRGVGSR